MLDCGHRTPNGRTYDDKVALLEAGICPVCPDQPLVDGLSAARTVTYHECACCGTKWTAGDGAHIRQFMQL